MKILELTYTRWCHSARRVGLRGAKVAANTIKPDLAIAVDVGIAYDTGMSGQTSDSKLGGGPVVIMMDATSIAPARFA